MNIVESISPFGCHDVVLLNDNPVPRHIDYLDLLHGFSNNALKVDAVVEFQSRPMLYIVSDGQAKNLDQTKLLDLQSLLANRGERAYLGVLRPGELNVFPINLDRAILKNCSSKMIKQEFPDAPLFFQSVVNGVFKINGQPEHADYVFKTIHDLMTRSSEALIECGLNPLDVLSFLGRVLFFRFLWDRKIVRPNELSSICPSAKSLSDCFRDVQNSIVTCQWLDKTFNGDLLPLSDTYSIVFEHANSMTEGKLFLHLRAILEGWKHAGIGAFQCPIDWNELDFAHIPIGVLSQVYENFSAIWDSRQREQTSAYYTPKNIARYLVDDAFEGVSNKADVKVLDPSCGAGIFLILAFRKLISARWEQDGKRPDTSTIQNILYNQLCGFDISESALRLSALSLYITAIELNGTPRPPKSLKFPKPLQGAVLHNHRRVEDNNAKGFVLGSLHSDLSAEFDGRFDIVIGNPPWSRLRGNEEEEKRQSRMLNTEFSKLTRQIMIRRGLADIAKKYSNPDNNPDLPFLWKATEWAKPGAIITMALPGRIFLKQTAQGVDAFHAILRGIEITGILNGSNLSDSEVWPGMHQPFMLFFARNRIPSTDHHFMFATPHFERKLNDKGRIRIDYQSAQAVATSATINDPGLLKTLSIGTTLDVEIISKLKRGGRPTVRSFWNSHGLYSGSGYNRSPKQPQTYVSFLREYPNFSPPEGKSFHVDVSKLLKNGPSSAHRPREVELYNPPMLIVPESPGDSLSSPKSWVIKAAVVFPSSYYGFSAHGSEDADCIIAILHLITHSDLFRYYVLLMSSKIGAERRAFLKTNIEDFPFPPMELLSGKQRQLALKLSYRLENSSIKPWASINDFVFNLYALDEYDRQVIVDTLEIAQPYKKARDRANSVPTKDERSAFYEELRRLLAPSFSTTNETVSVAEVEFQKQQFELPWYFFSISSSLSSTATGLKNPSPLFFEITQAADKTGCSRAVAYEKGYLLIGVVGQYRYWTLSRARLCAMDILRNHLDMFPVERN